MVPHPRRPRTAAGRGSADCIPLVGDHRHATIAWRSGNTIEAGTVSLRFELSGQVELYSFWFGGASETSTGPGSSSVVKNDDERRQ